MIDLKPRLLVHTPLGDFAVDPWASGKFDLSAYGVTDYTFQTDPASGQFTVTLYHNLYGPIVMQPFAPGPPTDLSMYGITGYEVVFGVPQIASSLTTNVSTWVILAGAALLGVWWWRR
jgi:hypothetical protein